MGVTTFGIALAVISISNGDLFLCCVIGMFCFDSKGDNYLPPSLILISPFPFTMPFAIRDTPVSIPPSEVPFWVNEFFVAACMYTALATLVVYDARTFLLLSPFPQADGSVSVHNGQRGQILLGTLHFLFSEGT